MPKTKHETPERVASRWAKRALARMIIRLAGRRKATGPPPRSPQSFVILAQEKLGDAILMTPLFANLKRLFPGAGITVVAFSRIGWFFEAHPHVDRVLYAKPDWLAFFRRARRETYDVLFNSKDHPSFTFLFVTLLLRTRHTVGFDHPYHQGYFHHLLTGPFHRHMVEKYCDFLRYLAGESARLQCRPSLPDGPVSAAVREFLSRKAGSYELVANLSAGEPDREWSLERWKEFFSGEKRPAVVVSMPGRYADKRMLEREFAQIQPSPGTQSIFDAAALIRHARCLVSPDTALVHVAACSDTPVVALYRADPDHVRRFGPLSSRHRSLVSPSYRVEDIPPSEAVEATEELLGEVTVPEGSASE